MAETGENREKTGEKGKKKLRILLRTFGCQMNVRDTEFVTGVLLENGFRKVDSAQKADVVLFNTCSVRKHAEERAISNMGALIKFTVGSSQFTIRKRKIFGMIGCSAQALQGNLFKRLPGLDIVCGTGQIHRLPQLIADAQKNKVLACGGVDRDIPELESRYRENQKVAFVSIMRGCNNFCSYCIVPYVRGKERSRKVKDIVKEVQDLTKRGIGEIILLGQNVNSYKGKDSTKKCSFVQLLKLINDIEGVEKIRFMTSHPKDASLELFKAIRDLDKLAKELHLPLQSGSDRILKLMNRGYSSRKYTGLIRQLRRLLPDCKITTDVIVGFPGESEADFRKTYRLMKEIKFNSSFIFKYSSRPPAKSALLKDNIDRETKERRHRILLDLQKRISRGITAITFVIVMLYAFFFSSGLLFAQTAGLQKAETLILKDAYAQAARECEKVLVHHHQSKIKSRGHYLLGICLLKESKYDEARKNFNIILQRYRQSESYDDATLGIADSYFLAGDFSQAGRKYEQFIRDFPHSELVSLARMQLKLCKEGRHFTDSYFSVQLGCFANKKNAEGLRNKLIDDGFQAYIVEFPSDSLYHVRVGKFNNRLEAEFLEQRLKARGYPTKLCP